MIPDDATLVGSIEVRCAQCDITVDVPVFAWIEVDEEDGRVQSLLTRGDMAEMWSHVWVAHES